MTKSIRFITTVAALGAAVASQAALLAFNGSGFYNSGSVNLTSVQDTGDDFGFGSGVVSFSPITASNGTLTLSDLGGDFITITYSGTAVTTGSFTGVAATGAITGASAKYSAYVSPNNVVSVTTNTRTTGTPSLNFTNVLGEVEAVPEPASIAALSVGAAALLRRRKKA